MGLEKRPEDVVWFQSFKDNYKNELHKTDLEQIASLHSYYTGHSYYKPCGCNAKSKEQIKRMVRELDNILLGGN